MTSRATRIEALETRQLLTALGSVDPTFGIAGTTTIGDAPVSTAPGLDGSQYFLTNANGRFRVTRLLASGRFDRAFGDGDGIADVDPNITTQNVFHGFHSMPDGRIVVIANSRDKHSTTGQDPLIQRLLPTGQPDSSFGNGAGIVRADFYSALNGSASDEFYVGSDVAADGAVAILVSDSHVRHENVRGLLVLDPDGTRDTNFNGADGGGSGLFMSSVHRIVRGNLQAGVNWSKVSFTLDGSAIDLAEDVNVFGPNAFLVAGIHRLPRTGAINDGRFVKGPDVVLADYSTLNHVPRVTKLVRLSDGGLLADIVPGTSQSSRPSVLKYTVVRMQSNLSIDTNFAANFSLDIRKLLPGYESGNASVTSTNAGAITALPDGRFYLTSSIKAKRIGAPDESAETLGVIMRFLSDGKPDPLFSQIRLPDRPGRSSNLPNAIGTFKESVIVIETETVFANDDDFTSATTTRRVRRYTGGPVIDLRSDGTLVLAGSSAGETIDIFQRSETRWEARNGSLVSSFQPSKIKRVLVHGYGGDDAVHVWINKPSTIHGGDGDDTLFGNESNDLIMGDAGDDLLDGGAGNDALYGHDGADTLYGGIGADRVFGNAGFDTVFGGNGKDEDTGRRNDGFVGQIEIYI